MAKIRMKTALCIFLFCLVVSMAFVGVIFTFYKNSIEGFSQSNTGLYLLTESDALDYVNFGKINIREGGILSTFNYNTNLFNQMYEGIFPLAAVFFLFLFSSSFLLMAIVNMLQSKENQKIATELINVQEGSEVLCENLAIASIYEEIEKKFQSNLKDYKRLNSYLSHEQKNAVAILRTTMELSGQKEYMSMLDRVSASIDDVLTLSENMGGTEVDVVDVALVCAEVVDIYKKTYPNITYCFPENEDSEIIAKERWIYRAVSNLIDNGIKYGGGEEIKISVVVKYQTVLIRVEDSGIGISEEKQREIFNDRYRINELNCDGYGIGLSLVSHVCDLCGGYVFVESQVGVGSTFILSFPKVT